MEWVGFEGRLRAAVALGLAMGTGCGPAVPTDDGRTSGSSGDSAGTGTTGAGTTADPSTTNVSASSATSPSTTTTSGSTGFSSTEDTPKFDIGAVPPTLDVGAVRIACLPEGNPPPACDTPLGAGEVLRPYCAPVDDAQACEAFSDDEFSIYVRNCLECFGFAERIVCERFALGDEPCCSWVVVSPGQSCPGRPFLVDGSARVPEAVHRSDWSRATTPKTDGLSGPTRERLAQAWAAEGCHEAASVASFSRFMLQLVALGAPAEFLSQAQAAIADEVEHARAFFGLAQAYGGVAVGPSEFPVDRALDGLDDPTSIAVSLATEGCIAETVSAMQLSLAAARASDPELRRILSEVAEQELQHAELAWSALAWMLQRGDAQLRARVAEVFVHAQDAVPRAVSVSDGLDPGTLRAVGRLTAGERLEVAQRALERCVAPAAAELLRPWTTGATPTAQRMG